MYGPAARRKMISESGEREMLHQCIRPLEWSFILLRATMGIRAHPGLTSGKTSTSPFLCLAIWLRRADRSSISSCHQADLGGELLNFISSSFRPSIFAGLREAIPAEPPSLAHPNRGVTVAERGGGHPCGDPEHHGLTQYRRLRQVDSRDLVLGQPMQFGPAC